MIHQTFALPMYVVRYAHKFMSDRAFLIMTNLIGANTKKDWETVAFYLDYKTLAPIKMVTKALEKEGLIVKKSYKIDWTPLFGKCYVLAIGDVPEMVEPPKKKPDHAAQARHALYHDMYAVAPKYLTGSKGVWVGSGKNTGALGKFIDSYDREDIIGCCRWMESYFTSTQPSTGVDNRGIYPNSIIKNIDRWIRGGKKETYTLETDFSDI